MNEKPSRGTGKYAKPRRKAKRVTDLVPHDPGYRPEWHKLSDGLRLFVDEYCIDLDIRRAAILSGLTYWSARNSIWTKCRDAIAETLELRFENCGIKAESVLSDLALVRDKCLGRIPVRTKALKHMDGTPQRDEHGNVLVEEEFDWDPAGANKALESLGRYLKLFTDTVVVKSHEQEMKEVWSSARQLGHDRSAGETIEAEVVGGLPVLQSDLSQDTRAKR